MSVDLGRLFGRFGRRIDLPHQIASYHRTPPEVLFDLAEFCGAIDPAPTDGDPFKQGRAAGRRDVWLHLQHQLNLTAPEVYALLKGEFIAKRPQENGL